MPDTSPRLDLPWLLPSQAQKHVTHNEALARLDLLVQMTVQALDAETPPAAPAPGQAFGLGPAPVAAWAGQGGRLAVWDGVAWAFVTPAEGWCAFDLTAGRPMMFAGGGWEPVMPDPQNLDGVGIGTTSDPVNRLAVAADATLLSHDGTDHRLKINKAAPGDTASVLFQSAWSGHAEMGLAGDTAFTIKISADGSSWAEVMRADPGAQILSFAPAGTARMVLGDTAMQVDVPITGTAVQVTPADATAGRLLTTGASATVLSASPALRVTTGGTADAITLTTGAALGAIPTGLSLRFRASAANTGATTINVDGTGAVACKTIRDAVLPAGYIRTDADTEIMYDGTTWIAERQSERASNANGWYVRHADGTQICQLKTTIKPASDATTGVKSYAWTYPAAFAAGSAGDISTVHNLQNSNPDQRFAVSVGSTTPTDCILFYNEPVGIASDIKTMATATGRWY